MARGGELAAVVAAHCNSGEIGRYEDFVRVRTHVIRICLRFNVKSLIVCLKSAFDLRAPLRRFAFASCCSRSPATRRMGNQRKLKSAAAARLHLKISGDRLDGNIKMQ